MSGTGAVLKPRRKPATYGKTSRRTFGDFQQSSVSVTVSDDEADANPIRSVTKSGLQQGHTSHRPDVGRHGLSNISNRKPNEKKDLLDSPMATQTKSRSNGDIFDFPSSEDEQTHVLTRPKPEVKRRKLQSPTSTHSGEMEIDSTPLESLSSSEGQTIHTAGGFHNSKRPLKGRQGIVQPLHKSTIQVVPPTTFRTHKAAKRSRNLGSSDSLGRRYESDLTPVVFSRKRVQLSQSPQEAPRRLGGTAQLPSHEHSVGSRHHISYSATKSPSQESVSMESGISVDLPRTPLRHSPVSADTSPKGNVPEPLAHSQVKYLSPGGLDIPNLHITAAELSAPEAILGSARVMLDTTKRAPIRTKLKDRLVSGKSNADTLVHGTIDAKDLDDDKDSESTLSSLKYSEDCKQSLKIDLQHSGDSQPTGSQAKLSDAAAPVHSRGLKVTYAARNRTVLRDETEDVLLSMPVIEVSDTPRSRRVVNLLESPNARSSQNTSQDMDDLDEPHGGALKSIHELREAGVNARVIRETEATLDDVDNSVTVSQKRSALIDLAMKLRIPSFSQQLLGNGLETRLFQHMLPNPDVVIEILLTIILLEILSGPSSSHLTSQLNQPSILNFVANGLERDDELIALAKERKSNMSRSLQGEMKKMCGSLKDSSVWRDGRPTSLTSRVISLQCMEYLVRHIRESGSTQEILSQTVVERLVGILKPLPSISDPGLSNTFEVQLALSTLESSTIVSALSRDEPKHLWHKDSVHQLVKFLVSICGWSSSSMAQMWILTLRLCINLTNGSGSTCDIFSTTEVIEGVVDMVQHGFQQLSIGPSEDDQGLTVDSLILSIGFLIHLAESKEKTRKLFLLRTKGSKDPLDGLLELFAARLQSAFEVVSEEESTSVVPFGYLAVLLSYLSITITIRERVAARLKGGTLRPLLAAVEEFIYYHRKVAEEIRTADEEVDLKAMFIGRLQVVVDMLKREESAV